MAADEGLMLVRAMDRENVDMIRNRKQHSSLHGSSWCPVPAGESCGVRLHRLRAEPSQAGFPLHFIAKCDQKIQGRG